jgi:hypothetical protein
MRARPDARATIGPRCDHRRTPDTGRGTALVARPATPRPSMVARPLLATPTRSTPSMLALSARARVEESLGADDASGRRTARAHGARHLERALRGLRWLAGFHVTLPAGDFGERWTGVRTPTRRPVLLRSHAGVRVGRTGAGRLRRRGRAAALAAVPDRPARARPPRGAVRARRARPWRRAVAVSLPTGFERTDPKLWGQLAQPLVPLGRQPGAHAAIEKAPYRGLAQFTPGDADLFVGREREAEGFANRLRITPLLAVVGPSGAGKSSFIQAGVMPLLGDGWTRLIVRPGGAPMTALDAMLVGATGVVTARPAGRHGGAGERRPGERLAAALSSCRVGHRPAPAGAALHRSVRGAVHAVPRSGRARSLRRSVAARHARPGGTRARGADRARRLSAPLPAGRGVARSTGPWPAAARHAHPGRPRAHPRRAGAARRLHVRRSGAAQRDGRGDRRHGGRAAAAVVHRPAALGAARSSRPSRSPAAPTPRSAASAAPWPSTPSACSRRCRPSSRRWSASPSATSSPPRARAPSSRAPS